MEEFNFNYGDHAHALRGATGHRSLVTQCINNLAGRVGALEVSPGSALTRTKINNNTSALDRAVAKANVSYTFYSTMDGSTAADRDAATVDQDAMTVAYTTARTEQQQQQHKKQKKRFLFSKTTTEEIW